MAALACALFVICLASTTAAQTVVTSCTECDTYATCSSNGTTLTCDCNQDFAGNGTLCEFNPQPECAGDVINEGFGMRVKLNQTYIDSLGIDPNDLRLLNASCGATLVAGYYVLETPDFEGCGGVQTGTGLTIQYTNVVSSDGGPSSSGVAIQLNFTCIVGSLIKISLNDGNSSVPILTNTIGQDKIVFPTISGTGTATATMYLYKDPEYSEVYNGVPVLATTDTIYVKIALDTRLNGINMRATRCWATPDAAGNGQAYEVIDNPGCMRSHVAGGLITSNGDTEEVKYQFQLFTYIQTSLVYIHCAVELCQPTVTNTCIPNCDGRRRKRDAETEAKILRSSLIIRSDEGIEVPRSDKTPEAPTTPDNIFNTSSEMFPIAAVLISVGAVLLLACVILIIYLCITRRREKEATPAY